MTTAPAPISPLNLAVVCGTLSRDPESRVLPSSDRLGTFEVTIRVPDRPAESVPVVWFEVPDRALKLAGGTEVVVIGRVRRRFFRTPAGTGSRTEVVASSILRASQRSRVQAALAVAAAELAGAAG